VTLVAVAHGTRTPTGRAQIHELVARIARRRPGLDLRLSYVDVQEPRIGAVLASLRRPAVVVPLLLTAGYHVRVDIASAATGTGAVLTRPLGDDPRIMDLLAQRIAAAGPADAVVLAAAGSSDPRARADVAAVARALPVPAVVGYAAAGTPRVAEVVARLRSRGARRVTVAAYLLVDGLFHRSLRRAGADAVTDPLVTAPAVEEIVLDRYDAARKPNPVVAPSSV
jgi:sirohydrochlorin ferrochelatase